MKKEMIYRKVLVSERVPSEAGYYITDVGIVHFKGWFNNWIEYWLEEIQLPSDEESAKYVNSCVSKENPYKPVFRDGFTACHNYILAFINNKK